MAGGGSPPRVRGPRLPRRVEGRQGRITPACAGTTSGCCGRSTTCWDHPRVCGDHTAANGHPICVSGSPPRVRGPPQRAAECVAEGRIIPACAGTTSRPSVPTCGSTDHPRVCGDHRECISTVLPTRGSPPRVRGPLLALPLVERGGRITPACAGTTGRWCPPPGWGWDHPRVCGDHAVALVATMSKWGSPPRVRGPRPIIGGEPYPLRITPACAGTTSSVLLARMSRRDHPRVCGDHMVTSSLSGISPGSPPRVRGPPRLVLDRGADQGITPACAGPTPSPGRTCPRGRDHPRVCGAHTSLGTPCFRASGSPPRVRGPRIRVDQRPEASGITPACAGTTWARTSR